MQQFGVRGDRVEQPKELAAGKSDLDREDKRICAAGQKPSCSSPSIHDRIAPSCRSLRELALPTQRTDIRRPRTVFKFMAALAAALAPRSWFATSSMPFLA